MKTKQSTRRKTAKTKFDVQIAVAIEQWVEAKGG